MRKQPNILFIMADQLAAQALPAYGNTVLESPHLDHLAEQGVVFENAYCNYPLCAPARFSMLSGRLPSRVGAYDNAAEFPASVPTFVHYLRNQGYRTCLSGKMHFVGPDQLHGFEERLTTDVYPSDFLWTADWCLEDFSWVPWYHSMRAVLDAGVWRRSVNIQYDDEVHNETIRWLHDYADAKESRPFFLTTSFISPHDPYLAPEAYWERYRDQDIDAPRVGDIPLDERDAHSKRHYYLTGRHNDEVQAADIRRMRRAYYAVTSYLDDKVGQLLEVLRVTGELDNTIIVVTADHGDMLGERGMFFKMTFFEWSARVPLIIHAPARFAAQRVKQVCSLVDLFPTLLEIAGDGQLPELVTPVDGHSLGGALSGNAAGGLDMALGEYTGEGTSAPILMVRKGAHKYVHCERDAPLLFDLESDPDELDNLAGREAVAGIETSLREEVFRHWSPGALAEDVLSAQRLRRFLASSLHQGQHTPWDFQPFRDASKQYFRVEGDVQDSYVRE